MKLSFPAVSFSLFLSFVVIPSAQAEGQPNRFLTVERWIGSLTIEETENLDIPNQCYSLDNKPTQKLLEANKILGSSKINFNVPVKTDTPPTNSEEDAEMFWESKDASGNFRWSMSKYLGCSNNRYVYNTNGSGSADNIGVTVWMMVRPEGLYYNIFSEGDVDGFKLSSRESRVHKYRTTYGYPPRKIVVTDSHWESCNSDGNCKGLFKTDHPDPDTKKTVDLSGKKEPVVIRLGNPKDLAHGGADSPENPAPASGMALSGHTTWKQPGDFGMQTVKVSWEMFPQGRSDFEAEVEIEDYDQWLPEGTTDANMPGQMMLMKVRVKDKKTGQYKPNVVVSKYSFKLINVSNEPGIAMNSPVKDPSREPDLKFQENLNRKNPMIIKENGQFMETKESKDGYKGKIENVVLSSFDWGAYGDLVVMVYIDGSPVIAYLKDHKDQKMISIPKRQSNSKIADHWKESTPGAAGKSDNDDGDDEPQGDGHAGDGLEMYEEYRGFYAQKRHVYGDPKKKDFFLWNYIANAEGGISLFEKQSGLKVHRLGEGEMTDLREINFNADPKKAIPQHGVIMKLGNGENYSAAKGGPGVPAQITEVIINHPDIQSEDGVSTIAHELFHSVSVWHHGDKDNWTKTWDIGQAENDQAIIVESGFGLIAVVDETGKDRTQDVIDLISWYQSEEGDLKPMPVFIGEKHGQHSGFENCIMRYNAALAYTQKELPKDIRILTDGEQTGMTLCNTEEGKAVNALGRSPRPYHGSRYETTDLSLRRGFCKRQICVNDKYRGAPEHRRL